MKFRKIVLAGGSGYLGSVLARYYKDKAQEIIVMSRSVHPSKTNIHFAVWDGRHPGKWQDHLEGADLLINLSGRNVNCRYTEKNKAAIRSSRIEPTLLLGKTIAVLANPPKVWLNLASATIYRHAEDRPQDEATGETGKGFSVSVCKDWEAAFWQCTTPATKKVALRTAIVLGTTDGVWPRLVNLVRVGLGGPQGDGKQYISWIHEHDFARATEWLFEHAGDGEVYNIAAPEAVTNRQFMKLMRQNLRMSFGLPAPAWLLAIGAAVIGTETELVLKSRWVYPGYLLAGGFKFIYPAAQDAIGALTSRKI